MARIALSVFVALVLAGCGGADTGGGDPPPSEGAGSSGDIGVELEGQSVAGGRLSVADLRGSIVFVNAWASW